MNPNIHIPGYTFVSKIADGGMATVWKARQDKLDRVVAIKVLLKQVDGANEDYNRFIYEARAAASLIHPNIVQVIDAGERDRFLYYVMEYVPGPTAGDVVSSGTPMPEPQVLQVALEVAEALDYAWRDHKVVHCDIKPDNLLLHRNGRTKIADLGLAQVLGKEGVAVEADMTIGTPNYFPPEQALVEDGLDCRADMYALGATMWHLATGKVPFGELAPDEVASMQVHGQIVNPKDLNPGLSWGFCCLVERLMAKDPLHRYDDWSGVMADILAVKEGRMIKVPPASNIRSTVAHTNAPKEKSKAIQVGSGPIRRTQGTRRRGGVQRTRGSAPPAAIHRQPGARPAVSVSAEQAAAVYARRKPLHHSNSIWPLVTAVALIVLFLYAFTALRLKG